MQPALLFVSIFQRDRVLVLDTVSERFKVTQHAAWWAYGSIYSKLKKTIEIHLIRLTEVCDKVLSEKYTYKSVKTALLFSNVIDADHQNSCLFTNKGHFSLPLWVLIGVLAKFHE